MLFINSFLQNMLIFFVIFFEFCHLDLDVKHFYHKFMPKSIDTITLMYTHMHMYEFIFPFYL